jgi:hypothetical protein
MAKASEELEQIAQEDEPTTEQKRVAVLEQLELSESTMGKGDLETGKFTSNSGVVLQLSRPNPNLIDKAMEKFTAPKVPEVFDEEFQANKPNPDDPDYVAAVEQYTHDTLGVVTDIYVSHIEVVTCPSNISPVHETDWEEDVTMFGITVPPRGRARILAWLNYYAINDDQEYKELITFAFMFNNRLKEDDVRARIDSFRSAPEPDADSTVPVEPVKS